MWEGLAMMIKFKLPKGRWTPLEVGSRLELQQLQNGVLRGAKVRITNPDQPNTALHNKPMQRICGV